MLDFLAALISSAFAVAMVTTILLQNRTTPQTIREGTTGLARIINAALARG